MPWLKFQGSRSGRTGDRGGDLCKGANDRVDRIASGKKVRETEVVCERFAGRKAI